MNNPLEPWKEFRPDDTVTLAQLSWSQISDLQKC